jgi:transposase
MNPMICSSVNLLVDGLPENYAGTAGRGRSNGLNANMIHAWRRESRGAVAPGAASAGEFVPLQLAGPVDASRQSESSCARAQRRLRSPGLCKLPMPARRGCARAPEVTRIEEIWLAVEPLGMRAGTETALGREVRVFGDAAHPHHAYLFANRRANRMKVLVHDGIGVWLAARRLNQGRFVGASPVALPRGRVACKRASRTCERTECHLPLKIWHEASIVRVKRGMRRRCADFSNRSLG